MDKNGLIMEKRNFIHTLTGLFKRNRHEPAQRGLDVEDINKYTDHVISDGILFNEIPSPTENEELRCDFISKRLAEFGYTDINWEEGSYIEVAVAARTYTSESLLIFTDIETDEYSPIDSLVKLRNGMAIGIGLTSNSIGISTALAFAEFFLKEEIELEKNIRILFTINNNPEHNYNSMRKYLELNRDSINSAIYLGSISQSIIGYYSYGNYRLQVSLTIPESDDVINRGRNSAIDVLAKIAFQLGNISWDMQGDTFLNIAHVTAGIGYGHFPTGGLMELEIFSRDNERLKHALEMVEATIRTIAEDSDCEANVTVQSYIPYKEVTQESQRFLKAVTDAYEMQMIPFTVGQIENNAIYVKNNEIPVISCGIADGRRTYQEEFIYTDSIKTGLNLLLSLIILWNKEFGSE
ncbi:MAG: hypothetical protein JW969_04955 [Spirochaetales bacterium]|nr:hypothetical protein [Spirochaetales bacterium]